jgi:hypothetical protein
MVVLILIAALVAGCASGSLARDDASREERAASVDTLLELAGTKPCLESMAKGLRPVVVSLSGVEVFGDRHLVEPVVEREVTMERLYAAVSGHLVEHYDAARFGLVARLLREPLIRRMTALEVASCSTESSTVAAWAASAGRTDAGRERLELARRIDTAVGATRATMDVLFGAGRGVLRAFAAIVPPGRRVSPDSFRADLARLEPDIRASTEAAIAYAYRDAPVTDIVRYAETLESETGRWFSQVQHRASVQAAERITETAMRRVLDVRRMPRT